MDDLYIVVRSVKERTESLCIKALSDYFPNNRIHTIYKTPFTEALKRNYEVAIQSGKKWVLCIDADTILIGNGINQLLSKLTAIPRETFFIQGYMLDKFVASEKGIREVGNTLYRTDLLPEALKLVPDPGSAIRPETHIKKLMQQKGFPGIKYEIPLGVHDFEQYYIDIYRKNYIQALKHKKRVELFLPYWESQLKNDPDFQIALQGFKDGLKSNKQIEVIDKNSSFVNNYTLPIEEKKPLEEWEFENLLTKFNHYIQISKYFSQAIKSHHYRDN